MRKANFRYRPHFLRSSEEVKKLDEFLEGKKGCFFDFRKEITEYCRMDVLVLALATLKLEKAILDETAYRISFLRSSTSTTAGLSALFYRSCFMPENSIGILPLSGYYSRHRSSALSTTYFEYLNKRRKSLGLDQIRFAKSQGGEFSWQRLSVDGYSDRYIIEVMGCYYHSCYCLFPKNSSRHPLYKITCGQARKLDELRRRR